MNVEGRSYDLVKEEGSTLTSLEQRRKLEELIWRVKLRIQWLREGEKIISIFHKYIVKHNKILSLMENDGKRNLLNEEIETILVDFDKGVLEEPFF